MQVRIQGGQVQPVQLAFIQLILVDPGSWYIFVENVWCFRRNISHYCTDVNVNTTYCASLASLVDAVCSHVIMPPLSVSSALPQQHPSLPNPFSPTLGYICGTGLSTQLEDDSTIDDPEVPPIGLRHARLQSTPSSCYSEWDSSLWNTWSSAMDSNMASARTSLISSVDSCYTNDSANFACLLAAAADTMSGASLSGKKRRKCFGLLTDADCKHTVVPQQSKLNIIWVGRNMFFLLFYSGYHVVAP